MSTLAPTTDTPAPKVWDYAHERLLPLGWTEDHNEVVFPANVSGDGKEYRYPLFDADEHGNLVIPYYRITGQKAEYRKGDAKWGKHYQVLRLRGHVVGPDGKVVKYKHPSGTSTLPWFPPQIIDAYNEGRSIDTIYFQEGVLKSYAGTLAGAMIVGVPGIHNVKDKGTMTLHADVIQLFRVCKPKQVVFLHDGDCRAFSAGWPDDPNVDLYKRPNSFFTSARNMGELLKDYARLYGFRTYYMHLVSDSIAVPPGMEQPKGLDDFLLAYQEVRVLAEAHRVTKDSELVLPGPEERQRLRALAVKEVIDDLQTFSAPPRFFERRDLDRPDKLRDYFHLRSADAFYAANQERIGEKEFVYDGTKYQWNETDKVLAVKVPSVSKKYVRVGTDYFKYIKKRNPHNKQLEEHLVPWKRAVIVEDNGKEFPQHVMKLEAFVNYPDHIAYQDIIDNCLNSYARFQHTPDPDADPPEATLAFMRHIFGSGTVKVPHPKYDPEKLDAAPQDIIVSELDLGLDYFKLLYEQPTQMMPILCLVSKVRGTGKTTFFNYLVHLFTSNATFIGAKDLENDFNGHYASKKIIIVDEALISKQESVEKMKSLSTSEQIVVNNKGVAQYTQAFFGVLLLGSNNIRNFIKTDDDEVRFWVRNVPRIPASANNTELAKTLVDEIPAFLYYLQQRSYATDKLFRSWFHPPLLVTDALLEVRKHSNSTVKRTVEGWIRGIFWAKEDLHTILMTAEDLKKELFPGNSRVDDVYIRQVLKEEMEVHTYRNDKGERATTPYSYWRIVEKRGDSMNGPEVDLQEVKIRTSKRPFVFKRENFITPEEEKEVKRELVEPVLTHTGTNGTSRRTERPGNQPELATTGNDTDDQDDLPF